jgi:CubicO group peptidase (beta-lactamase class C family)
MIASALDVPSPPDAKDIIRFMMGYPLDFDPGTKQAYSNFGYCILGRIIEKVSGMSYEDYVRTSVLVPAGAVDMRLGRSLPEDRAEGEVSYYDSPGASMMPSVFPFGPQTVPAPYGAFSLESADSCGGWIASAPGLLRFLLAVDGNPATPDVLQKETIDLMTAPPFPDSQDFGSYYALGWMVQKMGREAMYSHSGGFPGTATMMVHMSADSERSRLPNPDVSWVALFNSRPSDIAFYAELESEMQRAIGRIPVLRSSSVSTAPVVRSVGMNLQQGPDRVWDNRTALIQRQPGADWNGRSESEGRSFTAPARPELLQENISDMKMSLLYFDEQKKDRFVYIDGIKYIEGDYVLETYLLERITLAGAVLSYKGERAILGAGRR